MKSIFITGATRGIGRETALFFARRGWRVFGCGRDERLIAELNALAKKENIACDIFRMDVTKREEIEQGMARLMEATDGKGVDVLVNNAGYQELCPIEDLSMEGWRNQFETNVFGYLEMIRRLAPKMREQKQGRIINIASIAGRVTFPIYGAYSASKHAVEAISDALRMELKPFGVKVSIIEPGPMITNINITGYDRLAKNRPAKTAYAYLYDAGPKRLANLEANSYPAVWVTEKIWKAATARFPKQRYGVTWIWWAIVILRKFLPGWLQDFILMRSV